MSIILSHSTARAVYRTFHTPPQPEEPPLDAVKISRSKPTQIDAAAARRFLERYGVAQEPIHCTYSGTKGLPHHTEGLILHHRTQPPQQQDLSKLEPEIYLIGIEQCALQAATEMEVEELVEYYYELCGSYSLSSQDETEYFERAALTSVAKLSAYFEATKNTKGVKLARYALGMVRDGCRSPLETALALLIVLPKKKGGLGIKRFDTDHMVKVSARAAALTRRKHFYFDGYLESSKTDLEYNGFLHDADEASVIDEERRQALMAMGYSVIAINRHSLFDKQAFHRVMVAIIRREKIRPSRFPDGFRQAQEQLRKQVLRRYIEKIEKQKAEQKKLAEIETPNNPIDPLEALEINDTGYFDEIEPDVFQEPDGNVFGARR